MRADPHVVLVTGATSGIGRAAALALADDGWLVAAGGRDEERGAALARELGDRGTFLACDLREPGAGDRLVERAVAGAGRLDAVVNNAGVHFLATVEQTTPEALDELLRVNLTAAVAICRAAIPHLRAAGGGCIVNVASEAGIVAVPGQVAYNLSKAALVMLSRSLTADHAGEGIRSVSVCPGTTRTPLVEAAIAGAPDPEGHEQTLSSSRPAGRLGRVEEIAAAIVFCLREDVAFLTGTEVVVDGGYTVV